MNTDKLMELERRWREDGKRLFDDPSSETLNELGRGLLHCADELAAALRAEQAVGEDCNCLSLMADGTGPEHLVDCPAGQPAERGAFYTCPICHSLGVVTQETFDKFMPARQSEGVGKVFGMEVAHNPKLPPDSFVLVPRVPTEAMLAAARDERDRRIDYMLKPSFRGTWAAMLAAAPGGEGEG